MKTGTSRGFNIFVGFTFGLLLGVLLALASRFHNSPVVKDNAFEEEVVLLSGMKFTTTESGYIITENVSGTVLETVYENGTVATGDAEATGAVELEEDDTIKVLIVDMRGNTGSDIMSGFGVE